MVVYCMLVLVLGELWVMWLWFFVEKDELKEVFGKVFGVVFLVW